MKNELRRLEPGWLAGYTEDRELIRRIKDWRIVADYFKNGRLVGVQFKIPIGQRRQAERMFKTNVKEA